MKAKTDNILSLMYIEFGNLLLDFDCLEDSSRFLLKSLKMNEARGDRHGMRRAMQSLGKVLLRLGRFQLAEMFFTYCLDLKEEDNPGYDVFPLLGLVELYRFMGRYNDARKAAEEIKEKIHDMAFMKPYYYAVLSGLQMDTGKYKDAVDLINKAFAQEAAEARGEVWIELHARRAWCYYQTGDMDRALECLDMALKLARDKEAPYRESSITAMMSMLQVETGSREEALNSAQLAIDKAVSANSELCLSLAFESMGKAMNSSEQFDESAEYVKHSLRIARKTGHQRDICAALTSMARSHLSAGRHDDALLYAYRLLQYADEKLAPQRKEALLIIAHVNAVRGLNDEAAALLQPVLEWSKQTGTALIEKEARELLDKVSA